MSILSTVEVKVLAESLSAVSDHCENPVFVVSIEFSPTDTIWLSSSDNTDEIPVGGTTVDAKIREPSLSSSSLNPATLSTTVGGGTIEVVDINASFSKIIQTKKLAGTGSRQAIVSVYEVCKGSLPSPANRVHTLMWYNQSYSPGVVTLTLKELIYTTKETALNARIVKLAENYQITDTKIRVFDTGGEDISTLLPVFSHTHSYRNEKYDGVQGQGLNPSGSYDSSKPYNKTHEQFGYIRIKDNGNILCHTGFKLYEGIVWEADIIARGALGTTDSKLEIDEGIESTDNYPDIEEVIYLEESAPELACMIWTGTSINEKRTFPWGLNISRSQVNIQSLALLDSQEQTIPRIITSKSVKAKEFLQKDIMPIIGSFIDTDPDGRLSVRKMQTPTPDSSYIATLDHDNSEIDGNVVIDRDNINSTITVNWGYNESSQTYRYQTNNVYLESAALHGNTPEKVINLKWLQPGMQTDASLKTIIDRISMQNAFERVTASVKALPSMRYLKKGDVVFCNFDKMRDSAGADGNNITLKRPMLITGVQRVKRYRQVIYTLVGYTKRPRSGSTSNEVEHLSIEQINEHNTKTNLSTVCNITNGDITNPTNPIPVGNYFYDGDLRAINTVPYTISGFGTLDLWMPSSNHFEDNSTSGWFTGKGRGIHVGGKGEISGVSTATPGERGFFGSNTGGGGVQLGSRHHAAHGSYSSGLYVKSFDNGAITQAVFDKVPDLELRMENGKIKGLPDDLSGSGGGGGGRSLKTIKADRDATNHTNTYYNGSDGGRGGAGFRLVCGSFGFANGTQLDLSGGDAATPSTTVYGAKTFILGAGSGGAPGVMQIILPRGATPPDLAAYVKANFGSSGSIGTRLNSGQVAIPGLSSGTYHSYSAPPNQDNHSVSSTLVSEIPSDRPPEEPPNSFAGEEWRAEVDSLKDDLDAQFANTMRTNITIHYSDEQPSGATELDYWLDTNDADSENRVKAYQLISNEWSISPLQDAHAQLLINNWKSATDAEKAKIAADSKSTTFKTDSENPNDWPDATGYGDLLYVSVLSEVYRCVSPPSWDVSSSYIDEMAVTSAANIMIDGGFQKAAFEGKKTYKRSISECVFNRGKNNYASNATIEYGSFGEGPSAGAKITITNGTGTTYSNNADFATLEVPAEKFHQAGFGDIFRITVRGKSDGFFGFGVDAFDSNYNKIGRLGIANFGVVGWFTKAINIEVNTNSSSIDFSKIQFIRGFLYASDNGASNATSTTQFDHVSMERADTWRDIISPLSTAANGLLQQSDNGFIGGDRINVYSTSDQINIKYAARYKGDSSGDAIAFNMGLGYLNGTQAHYKRVESNLVVGNSGWTSVLREVTLSNIPTGEYQCGYNTWGSVGTEILDPVVRIEITRG